MFCCILSSLSPCITYASLTSSLYFSSLHVIKKHQKLCVYLFFYIRTINQDCVYEVNQCAFLVKLLSVDLYWGLFPLLRSLKKIVNHCSLSVNMVL